MLPLFLIALVASYFVGSTAFNIIMALGILALIVPFVVVAANKRYLGPNIPNFAREADHLDS
jgi:hypothetical protein